MKISSQHAPHTSIIADTLSLPHPQSSFDFAISIAVIHHLSTPARRIAAIAAILETLRPSNNKNNDEHHLNNDNNNDNNLSHSWGHGHLRCSTDGGGRALIYVWALEQKHSRRGWDEGDAQDVMVPWVMKNVLDNKNDNNNDKNRKKNKNNDNDLQEPQPRTFKRYYHLYRQGELEDDIQKAGGRVERSGYEKDNWWAIASRSSRAS